MERAQPITPDKKHLQMSRATDEWLAAELVICTMTVEREQVTSTCCCGFRRKEKKKLKRANWRHI